MNCAKIHTIAINITGILLLAITLLTAIVIFYIPHRNRILVQKYVLQQNESIADAVSKRTPGCTNVVWSANDLGVFAEAQTAAESIIYKFCVEQGRAAAASGRTEKVFPEISLGIGGDGDQLFHPFMMSNNQCPVNSLQEKI